MIKYAAYFLAGLATSLWTLGFIYLSHFNNFLYFFAWLLIPVVVGLPLILLGKTAKVNAK